MENINRQLSPQQPVHSMFGDELNIDIHHYIRVLRKYKWFITGLTFAVTLLVAYYAYSLTPIYRSTSTLLIESQKANLVSIEEIYGFDGANAEYYQTQFELLKSRALAEKVVKKLDLHNHKIYNSNNSNASIISILSQTVTAVMALFSSSSSQESESDTHDVGTSEVSNPDIARGTSAGDSVALEEMKIKRVAGSVLSAMSIQPVRRTKLVKISFESPDPALAATVANGFGEVYIESYLDAKMEMTQKAAEWLADRLGSLQLKLEDSEVRLLEFRENNNLVDVDGTVGKLSEQRVKTATEELASANRELIEAKNVFQEVEKIRADNPEMLDAFPLIQQNSLVQTFRVEKERLEGDLDELYNRYGEKHPKIIDAKLRIEVVTESLNRQIGRVIASIRRDYESAQQKVDIINSTLRLGKQEIQDINKKKFQLSVLQREVEANRKLYDTFFNRIRETDEADGLEIANARISDYAIPAGAPSKPRKSIMIGLALLLGLLGSILIAFLRELMDDTVKGTDEIESRLNIPLLGIIPLIRAGLLQRQKKLPLSPFELKDTKGTFVESIRTVRTSLCLDSLENPHKRVVITSSVPGEGKSTLAINLAHSLSQLEKVILIDADMRRPTVGKAFNVNSDQMGLADYLGSTNRSEAIHISECVVRNLNDSNLDVLPCGALPENPLELLASSRFARLLEKLGEHYDRVIIDCAPTQAVSDALVVGKLADTVLYAVKSHTTSLSLIRRGLQRLRQVGAHVLGVVVTQVDVEKISAYGGDYYYQGYYDYYGYSGDKKGKKKKKRRSEKSEDVVADEVDEAVKETA